MGKSCGRGRLRTLSNSEMSSSALGSQDEKMDVVSENDSWTVSNDMLMIDEVHTSEESENLSSVASDVQKNNIQKDQFFNIAALDADRIPKIAN